MLSPGQFIKLDVALHGRHDHTRLAILRDLESRLTQIADRAHVPYSGMHEAAILLLGDGTYIPGVRIESATFSLTITALVSAVTSAVSSGRSDVAALIQTRPLSSGERAYLEGSPFKQLEQVSPVAYVSRNTEIPALTKMADPFDRAATGLRSAEGIRAARAVAHRAYVPASEFPVGCILHTADGTVIPGVNVENDDWTHILCAERSALASAISFGASSIEAVYVSCLQDPTGTPCGACRQLLAELAPQSTLWMDRGDAAPESATPGALLPGFFTGTAIKKSLHQDPR